MALTIDWLHEDNTFADDPGRRYKRSSDNSLIIEIKNIIEDGLELEDYVGKYTCLATNGLPAGYAKSDAKFNIPGVVARTVTSAGFTLWWVILLIAIILIILILILCCCLCYQKNKGDTYPGEYRRPSHFIQNRNL